MLFGGLLRGMDSNKGIRGSEMTTIQDESPPDELGERALLVDEVEELHRVCHNLRQKLDQVDEHARRSQQAQLVSEEKTRRQGQLLEEATKRANLAQEENRKLIVKVHKLQNWTERLDDEETKQLMRRLYHGLETWVKQHFCYLLPTHSSVSSEDGGNPVSSDAPLGLDISYIHGALMELIFHYILSRFMVGIEDLQLNTYFFHVNTEVQRLYPSHVGQHWRTAMSSALLSLAKPVLVETCNRIAGIMEARFSRYSGTSAATRTRQLKDLLWEFVEFKSKLERQGQIYHFWWMVPGMTVQGESMESLTGQYGIDEIVEICLWPLLSTSLATEDEPTVVGKAIVKSTSRVPCTIRDRSEFDSLVESTEGSS
ncbi:uncharacterized protein N7459_007780 [Penicillium hispanicum]|uniref:uncharacterized protein n=1 Tax=Penicillium hispanicum TaxID=1080232 RepID=UPI002541457F|nr:uncharacterized protein N7459_007780 [Penicillium hispanicum]KAJ5573353.1 hypothetical protein N7459_007780 [Penicillium hispanicum]